MTSLASGAAEPVVEAAVEGLLLGAYRVARTGRKAQAPDPAPARVLLSGVDTANAADAVRRGTRAARATVLARDLANTRSSTKGPAWLAGRATRAARAAGLDVRVWSEAELRAEGFAAILAVGSGAERGPRLVQLEHRPDGPDADGRPHVVLAGKGITFDTGGISLKPREAMLGMTTDMTGAAVVLAVLAACREHGVRARVTGLMPLAENAFGAGSYRPADVVRTYDGTTVEVRNTDAEGRMVLADAMGYARTRLRPDVMVDVATLTGAATQALGRTHAALYATDDRLSAALVRAGEAAGERLWPMPLVEDYRALIDSDVADICQISTDRAAGAGSVMAALFLREFAGDVPWAHLDIAGPARSDRDRAEVNRGGTGFGARLLLRWLQTPLTGSDSSALDGHQEAVAGGEHGRDQARVAPHGLAQLADRRGRLVPLRGVGDPVVPEGVVEGQHAAGPQQPHALLEVLGVLQLVGVAQHQVVRPVGQPGQHLQGRPADQARAVRRDAGLGERLAGGLLVLVLDVDAGQHAVLRHAVQQPQSRDTGAGADLDDGARGQRGREHPQRRPDARLDGGAAELLGPGPGPLEDLVLLDEPLRVRPGRGLLSGDVGLPGRGTVRCANPSAGTVRPGPPLRGRRAGDGLSCARCCAR